jgi:hypothetical protein
MHVDAGGEGRKEAKRFGTPAFSVSAKERECGHFLSRARGTHIGWMGWIGEVLVGGGGLQGTANERRISSSVH